MSTISSPQFKNAARALSAWLIKHRLSRTGYAVADHPPRVQTTSVARINRIRRADLSRNKKTSVASVSSV
jgi:hypothetical protein